MKVQIDSEACIGCGLCVQISSELFEMDGDLAIVKSEEVSDKETENVKESVDSCPTDAIIIIE